MWLPHISLQPLNSLQPYLPLSGYVLLPCWSPSLLPATACQSGALNRKANGGSNKYWYSCIVVLSLFARVGHYLGGIVTTKHQYWCTYIDVCSPYYLLLYILVLHPWMPSIDTLSAWCSLHAQSLHASINPHLPVLNHLFPGPILSLHLCTPLLHPLMCLIYMCIAPCQSLYSICASLCVHLTYTRKKKLQHFAKSWQDLIETTLGILTIILPMIRLGKALQSFFFLGYRYSPFNARFVCIILLLSFTWCSIMALQVFFAILLWFQIPLAFGSHYTFVKKKQYKVRI